MTWEVARAFTFNGDCTGVATTVPPTGLRLTAGDAAVTFNEIENNHPGLCFAKHTDQDNPMRLETMGVDAGDSWANVKVYATYFQERFHRDVKICARTQATASQSACPNAWGEDTLGVSECRDFLPISLHFSKEELLPSIASSSTVLNAPMLLSSRPSSRPLSALPPVLLLPEHQVRHDLLCKDHERRRRHAAPGAVGRLLRRHEQQR